MSRPPYNLRAFGIPGSAQPGRGRRGPSLGGLGTPVKALPVAVTKVAQRYADGLKILVQSPGKKPLVVPVNVKNVGVGVEVPSLGVTAPNASVRVALVTRGNRIFWRVNTAMQGKQPTTREMPYAPGQTKPPALPQATPAPAPITPLVSVTPKPATLAPAPSSGQRNDRFDVPPPMPAEETDFIEPEVGPEPVVSIEDNVRRLIPPTGVVKASFAPASSPASAAIIPMVPQRSISSLVYVAGAAVAGLLLLLVIWRRSTPTVVFAAPQTAAWRSA